MEGILDFFKNNKGVAFGIGGALLGLLVGGTSTVGILLAAFLGFGAMVAGPAMLEKFTKENKDNIAPDELNASTTADSRGRGQSTAVGKPHELDVKITELPAADEPNKGKIRIDGKEYDMELLYKAGRDTKGEALVEYVSLKRESDGYVKFIPLSSPVKVGAYKEDNSIAFDAAGMDKLAEKIGKARREEVRAAMNAAQVSGLKAIDNDTYIVKGGDNLFIVEKSSDGKNIEIKNLHGKTLDQVTLDQATKAPAAFASIVGDKISEMQYKGFKGHTAISSEPVEVRLENALNAVRITADERGLPNKEGNFIVNWREGNYRLEYEAKGNDFIAKSITFIADGKDISTYVPKQRIVLGHRSSRASGADPTFEHPAENGLQSLIEQGLNKYDTRIAGINKLLEIKSDAPSAVDQRSYLLNGKYEIKTNKTFSGFTTEIRNLAEESKTITADGKFTSENDALKAALHAIVDSGEPGAKGLVKSSSPDMSKLVDVVAPRTPVMEDKRSPSLPS